MRNKSGHIIGKLLLIFLLISAIFISFQFKEKPETESSYRGKIVFKAIIDGNSMGDLETFGIYLQGTCLLEKIYSIRSNGLDSATGKVVAYGPNDPQYRTLTGYYMTDFLKGIVFEFDSSGVNPKLLNTIPISKKKFGLNLLKEMKEIQDVLGNFSNKGDTSIEGVRYKILADLIPREMPGGFTLEKSIAYLNPNIKNFPIKFSTYLDKKFDGWVSRLSFSAKKDSIVSNNTFELLYIEGLNPEDQRLMDKYIQLTKDHFPATKDH